MSTRGAIHGLMASAGLGIVSAKPIPTGKSVPVTSAAGKQPGIGLGVADATLQRDRERHERPAEQLVVESGPDRDIAACPAPRD